MSMYKIYPLKTGTIIVDQGAYVTRGIGLGREVEIPGTAWYVTDGRRKIMVDAGMCHTKLADWHHKGSRQEPGEAVHEQLRARGVDPAEIEWVILTHLHWDHCHNLDQFPKARFLVHSRELDFARDPIPPYYKSYEHPRLGKTPPFRKFPLRLCRVRLRFYRESPFSPPRAIPRGTSRWRWPRTAVSIASPGMRFFPMSIWCRPMNTSRSPSWDGSRILSNPGAVWKRSSDGERSFFPDTICALWITRSIRSYNLIL